MIRELDETLKQLLIRKGGLDTFAVDLDRGTISSDRGDDRLEVSPQNTFEVHSELVTATADAPKDYAVSSKIIFDSAIARGGVAAPNYSFGIAITRVRIDNIAWSCSGRTVYIQAYVFADSQWGIQSRGRTNVSGATDTSVNADTWRKVAADLEPDATGRPTRAEFWAEDLSASHEQFHAQDDINCGRLQVPAAELRLNSQTLAAPVTDAKVQALLSVVRRRIQAEVDEHYLGGGEDRAYANG
jgi:hypothetical protein